MQLSGLKMESDIGCWSGIAIVTNARPQSTSGNHTITGGKAF